MEVLNKIRDGQITVRSTDHEVAKLAREVRRSGNRTVLAVAGAAAIIAAAILHTATDPTHGVLLLGITIRPTPMLLGSLGMGLLIAAWLRRE